MTKLQTIEAEIQALSVDERRELISKFRHLVTPEEDYIFEFTEAQSAELDRRMKNDTSSSTLEEVMDNLSEEPATGAAS